MTLGIRNCSRIPIEAMWIAKNVKIINKKNSVYVCNYGAKLLFLRYKYSPNGTHLELIFIIRESKTVKAIDLISFID
jgi:hypothetical protein